MTGTGVRPLQALQARRRHHMVLAVFLPPPPPAAAGGKINKTSGQLANPSRSRVVKRQKRFSEKSGVNGWTAIYHHRVDDDGV